MIHDLRIQFNGKTNSDNVFLNTAHFAMPDGKEVTVDRRTTYYDVEDGELDMEWRGCHIWDDNGENYDIPDDFKDARFLYVEVEDDAPADYEVTITKVSWG